MKTLEANGISVDIDGKQIVKGVSFRLQAGEKLMIVGPNGAGKTTLIRAVMQAVPHIGNALLDGRNVALLKPAELARQMGVLTQNHSPQFSYSVRDVVALGRYPHRKGFLSGLTAADEESIELAMKRTGIDALAGSSIQTLSGGELQRVFLAQLFAQDPAVLILDEPTNNLDLSFQIAMFDMIDDWVKGEGKAAIAVIHDLNIVYRYASKALLMSQGECFAYGDAEEALSPENLNSVYHADISGWMKGLLKRWESTPC
jgi:iron complex transport system ATP-binding protein